MLRALGAARVATAAVLVAILSSVVAQRMGVDLGESARARAVVHVGSARLVDHGADAEVREVAAVGKLIDDGLGGLTLELEASRSYSTISGPEGPRRIRHRGGIYDDYETFFGTPVPRGVLEFRDALGQRRVVVEFGYPDHDSETGSLVYHLRRLGGVGASGAQDDGLPLAPGRISDVEVRLGADG